MPEGPEARTVADQLAPVLQGRYIMKIFNDGKVKSTGLNDVIMMGVAGVGAHGKRILIYLQDGRTIVIFLGMTGRILYLSGGHDHFIFQIGMSRAGGFIQIVDPEFNLYYGSTRHCIGSIDVVSQAGFSNFFAGRGIDLLAIALAGKEVVLADWLKLWRHTGRRRIKDSMLDTSITLTIGNYLKSEILYEARINPLRPVNTLTMDEWDAHRRCSHRVVVEAYRGGGLTISDFISPNGTPGTYPARVYGKQIDPLGNPVIKHKDLDDKTGKDTKGRSTFWVPTIQH